MSFALHRPETVVEAVAAARHLAPRARFSVGGTDFIIQINRKRVVPDNLIDISRLAGLSVIEDCGHSYAIGALTTHKAIERFAPFGPHWTLLSILRGPLGLFGTKANCLEAECGVCTVLLDGRAVNACILPAVQCEGRNIVTIEGLGDPEHLHPLQAAFIAHGAVQCGYCIRGMILRAKSYLDENLGRVPTRDDIREAISGTLCRCTGYHKIVDAVLAAAQEIVKAEVRQHVA